MKAIGKEVDNMGGVLKIWAIKPNEIVLNGNTVQLLNEGNIYELQVTQDTASMAITMESDFKGHTYLHEAHGFIAGYNSDSAGYLAEMSRIKKFVIICQDGLGNLVLLGRPTIPLKFTKKLDTGDTTAAKRGFEITFSGRVHFNEILLTASPFGLS